MSLGREFYERPVVEVARDLVGCIVRHGEAAGRVVEAEAFHESEPSCHSFVELTPRTEVLGQGAWLESKVSEGGTALARVREQLERARELLDRPAQ